MSLPPGFIPKETIWRTNGASCVEFTSSTKSYTFITLFFISAIFFWALDFRDSIFWFLPSYLLSVNISSISSNTSFVAELFVLRNSFIADSLWFSKACKISFLKMSLILSSFIRSSLKTSVKWFLSIPFATWAASSLLSENTTNFLSFSLSGNWYINSLANICDVLAKPVRNPLMELILFSP